MIEDDEHGRTRCFGRHSQQSGDAQRGPTGDGLDVDPEGHPRHDDYERRRQVRLDEVEPDCPAHVVLRFQAAVVTCQGRTKINGYI